MESTGGRSQPEVEKLAPPPPPPRLFFTAWENARSKRARNRYAPMCTRHLSRARFHGNRVQIGRRLFQASLRRRVRRVAHLATSVPGTQSPAISWTSLRSDVIGTRERMTEPVRSIRSLDSQLGTRKMCSEVQHGRNGLSYFGNVFTVDTGISRNKNTRSIECGM